ncbi:MAG: DUF92 domain-containing protein [Thermoplasmatales archaeon]
MNESNLWLLILIPILFYMSLKLKVFSRTGAIASAAVGAIIIIGGGWLYFVMLFLFLGLSYISTLAGFEKKNRRKLQEGISGERGARNVLAAGLIPAAASLLLLWGFSNRTVFFIYMVSLGVILADTAASEIGSLQENTYLILTLKPVETGVNGGVSVLGTTVSLIFPLLFSLIGYTIFGISSFIPFDDLIYFIILTSLLSFVGSIFDSILGEILENRGYLTKYGVYFFAALFSFSIASFIVFR